MKQTTRGWVAAMAVGAPLLALGQPDQPAQRTAAQPLKFQSAFDDYKPYRSIEPGDWRGLNDAVGAAALKSGAQTGLTAAPGALTPTPPAMPGAPVGAKAVKGMKGMKGMHHGAHGSSHDRMHGGQP